MREILFRGKRLDDGKWVYGYVFDNGIASDRKVFVGGLVVSDATENTDDRYEVGLDFEEADPSTIGQYAGLTDKNGVKIFEGDIVQTKYGRLCIVDWFESNSTLCFDQRPLDIAGNLLKKAPDNWDLWYEENIEVIGNIHDNPELMTDRRAD